jgi:hypothetical protein
MEYPRWGPEEQEHLQILKATLSEEGLFDGLPPYEDAYGDRKWIRFIRGYPGQFEKAVEEARKYLVWRKENNMDAIRDEILSNHLWNPSLFPRGQEVLKHIPQVVVASIPRVSDPEETRGENPFDGYLLGAESFDFSPSSVMRIISMDEYHHWIKYCYEFKSMILEIHSQRQEERNARMEEEINEEGIIGAISQLSMIRDLGGVGFEHVSSQSISIVSAVIGLSSYYPELLRKTAMIRAPFVFSMLWTAIKFLLSERALSKISFVGSDFEEAITNLLPEPTASSHPFAPHHLIGHEENWHPQNFEIDPQLLITPMPLLEEVALELPQEEEKEEGKRSEENEGWFMEGEGEIQAMKQMQQFQFQPQPNLTDALKNLPKEDLSSSSGTTTLPEGDPIREVSDEEAWILEGEGEIEEMEAAQKMEEAMREIRRAEGGGSDSDDGVDDDELC